MLCQEGLKLVNEPVRIQFVNKILINNQINNHKIKTFRKIGSSGIKKVGVRNLRMKLSILILIKRIGLLLMIVIVVVCVKIGRGRDQVNATWQKAVKAGRRAV